MKQTRTEAMVDKQLVVTRQIEDVHLYDVGPVVTPAYEETDVSARQIDFRSLFHDGCPAVARVHLGELGVPVTTVALTVGDEERERLRLRLELL